MKIFLSLLTTALLLISCAGVKISEYFPSTQKTKTILYKIDRNPYTKVDTLFTGAGKRKSRIFRTINKHLDRKASFDTLYYNYFFSSLSITDTNTVQFNNAEYYGYSFLSGNYFHNKKGLFVSPWDWRWDTDQSSCCPDFYRLFPKKMKQNKEYILNQTIDYRYTYRFIGFENIQIGDSVLSNCIRIEKCRGKNFGEREKTTVWLQKDFGFVKCETWDGKKVEVLF